MWILTESFNDYNQHGDVFVAAFKNKPNERQMRNELKALGSEYSDADLEHLLNGGGRQNWEDSWYNLFEYKPTTNSL